MLCNADLARDVQLIAAEYGRAVTWQFFIDACDRILVRDETDWLAAAAMVERGVFFDRLGQHEKALVDFNTALQMQPDLARAYVVRARHHHEQKAPVLAEQDLAAAKRLAFGPNRPFILDSIGWERVRQGDYRAGLNLANEALAAASFPQVGYVTRAHALMGLERHALAEAAFLKAIENRGNALVRRYQSDLARKGYQPGRSDGVMDDATLAALRACIRDNCRLLLD